MPLLLPPPMPRLSCSMTRTAGKRSCTASTVPSVEPLSTTITSSPSTDARHCSIQGSAFQVTTTTVTSGTATAFGHRRAAVEHLLPEDHRETGEREDDRRHEEQEAARERGIGVDADVAEEADEERLPDAEPVDRERHEHDEEEQGPEHDVGQQRKVDPDGTPRRVDGDDAGQLQHRRHHGDHEERPDVVAVAVDPLVDRACDPLHAEPLQQRHEEPDPPACAPREEDDAGDDRPDHEEHLGPDRKSTRLNSSHMSISYA